MTPMPCSRQYGKISRCMRRSNRFQPYWATSTRRTLMQAVDLLPLEVRDADEAGLPLAHDVLEGAHRLLERGPVVGPVHEVDVDAVGAEVLEALLDRCHDACAAGVAEVRLVPISDAELGDEDRVPAAPAERPSERALRRAEAVPLGGVEAVDAEVERAPDGAGEFRLLDPPVAAADLPAAEADGRDLEPRPSEWSLLHQVPFVRRCSISVVLVQCDSLGRSRPTLPRPRTGWSTAAGTRLAETRSQALRIPATRVRGYYGTGRERIRHCMPRAT